MGLGHHVSKFWILLELRVMEVVVATGKVNRHAKLQSNRYHQQSNTQLFFYRPDALPVVQPTLKGIGPIRCLSYMYSENGEMTQFRQSA